MRGSWLDWTAGFFKGSRSTVRIMVANNDDQNPTKRARQCAASGAQPSGQAADSKRVAASGAQPATASGEMHGAASGAKADKYVPFVDLMGLLFRFDGR